MTMTPVETSKGCEDSKDRAIMRYQTLIICIGRFGRAQAVLLCVATYLRSYRHHPFNSIWRQRVEYPHGL